MKSSLYVGLVHYPIYDKHFNVIATAITNYDLHDISRSAKTYGVKKYFIIHHVPGQLELAAEKSQRLYRGVKDVSRSWTEMVRLRLLLWGKIGSAPLGSPPEPDRSGARSQGIPAFPQRISAPGKTRFST